MISIRHLQPLIFGDKKSFRPRYKGRKQTSVVPPLFICTSLYKSYRVRHKLIILRQYNGCNRHSLISERSSACSSGMYSGFCFMHLSSAGYFLYKTRNPYWFPSLLFFVDLIIALSKKKCKQFFQTLLFYCGKVVNMIK